MKITQIIKYIIRKQNIKFHSLSNQFRKQIRTIQSI